MGKYDPRVHHRHSIRLKGYDYSQAGLYFVTMNTQYRLCLFGKIRDGVMILSPAGEMVQQVWQALPGRFECVFLHDFVIMPDHFHGIMEIEYPVGGAIKAAQLNEEERAGIKGAGTKGAGIKGAGTKGAGTRPAQTRQGTGQAHPSGASQWPARTRAGEERPARTRAAQTLGDMVGAFKSLTTHKYIQGVREAGWPPFIKRLWQRNYYERIIRNERAYNNISAYIRNNPVRWQEKKGE
jgi:REP element-mobilizing transposase RayT